MIHSFFIRKVCRGNVSDAFKGQFVLPISALRGSEENNKKTALWTQQRWLHFPLPLVTFLHVNYSSFLPLKGGGTDCFLGKRRKEEHSSPSLLTPLILWWAVFIAMRTEAAAFAPSWGVRLLLNDPEIQLAIVWRLCCSKIEALRCVLKGLASCPHPEPLVTFSGTKNETFHEFSLKNTRLRPSFFSWNPFFFFFYFQPAAGS